MLDNPQNTSRIKAGEKHGQSSKFHQRPRGYSRDKALFILLHAVTAISDTLEKPKEALKPAKKNTLRM